MCTVSTEEWSLPKKLRGQLNNAIGSSGLLIETNFTKLNRIEETPIASRREAYRSSNFPTGDEQGGANKSLVDMEGLVAHIDKNLRVNAEIYNKTQSLAAVEEDNRIVLLAMSLLGLS